MSITRALVIAYLAAIVAANLLVAKKGPTWSIYLAFIFVALDLVCRDRLHDAWAGHVRRNMAALIVGGSVLSYLVSLAWATTYPGGPSVGRIAFASCVAFGVAATADALVYQWRHKQSWSDRSNESNVAGAATDSVIFTSVAFGGILSLSAWWAIVFGQFCAKVAGGYCWSIILKKRSKSDPQDSVKAIEFGRQLRAGVVPHEMIDAARER